MLGARAALSAAVPGLAIDAKVGRFMGEAGGIVGSLAARNQLPDSVIVHLGANGPASSSEVVDVIEAAGGRRVVFVTVKVPRRWEATTNSAITKGAENQPTVRIVDWKSLSSACPGQDLLYDDGTHLKPDGASCYANLIAAALVG